MVQVLIADDNPLTRRRVEAATVRWGYEPITVSTGNDAWARLSESGGPRLAIMDWIMPGLNGPEICRLVRASATDRYIYVVLLTSSTDQKSVVDGLTAGADDFVCKPFHSGELEQRLRTGRRILELEDRFLAAQEQLRLQSSTDSLTGLFNRREILRRLDRCQRQQAQGAQFSVMLVDVDFFKSVNDRFGHLVGDDVLRNMANIIEHAIGSGNAVGRYGGEEFLVVLPETDAAAACEIAEKLRTAVASPQDYTSPLPCSVTVSIGVAGSGPRTSLSTGELLRRADIALYQAKREGRDQVRCFDPAATGSAVSLA